uniref:Uncharacterized protein n=1 Tax=Schistosoma japonicum TaxID=6182 RepID=C1LDC5_SCHJA|nr:hypothetical protein [Schistosoma japonicum]
MSKHSETQSLNLNNTSLQRKSQHVPRTIHNTGAQAKVTAELRFNLSRSYKRHRYDTVDIAVDFIHSWF